MTDTTVTCEHRWRKVAVIDGIGPYAECSLYRECAYCDEIEELQWPSDWPSWARSRFLNQHGFKVITA